MTTREPIVVVAHKHILTLGAQEVARDIVSMVRSEQEGTADMGADEQMGSERDPSLDTQDDESDCEDYLEMMRLVEEAVMAEILEQGGFACWHAPATCASAPDCLPVSLCFSVSRRSCAVSCARALALCLSLSRSLAFLVIQPVSALFFLYLLWGGFG